MDEQKAWTAGSGREHLYSVENMGDAVEITGDLVEIMVENMAEKMWCPWWSLQ